MKSYNIKFEDVDAATDTLVPPTIIICCDTEVVALPQQYGVLYSLVYFWSSDHVTLFSLNNIEIIFYGVYSPPFIGYGPPGRQDSCAPVRLHTVGNSNI